MKRFLSLLFVLLIVMPAASAESITLGNGTWRIGEDIPAGYYKITKHQWGTMVMCDVIDENLQANIDASTIVRWLDTKSEYLLKDGLYLCIDWGKFSFTPIQITTAQAASETFGLLLDARHNAMWNNYEDKELFEQSVPVGVYTVGIDIPEGNWCIRYFDSFTKTLTLSHQGEKTRLRIFSPSNSAYTPDKLTHSFLKLQNGDTIEIEADKGDCGLFFIPLADFHIH